MEITLENKAKFFSQYCGHTIISDETGVHLKIGMMGLYRLRDSYYLELTPLSAITDEDAIEVGILFGCAPEIGRESTVIRDTKDILEDIHHFHAETSITQINQAFDFLRSKGYALSWMGLTVEQLIEAGWVKLKDGAN